MNSILEVIEKSKNQENEMSDTASKMKQKQITAEQVGKYFAQFQELRVDLSIDEAHSLTLRIGDSISERLHESSFMNSKDVPKIEKRGDMEKIVNFLSEGNEEFAGF